MTLQMHAVCGIVVLPEQMRVNGVMDGQPVVKKRRGRRKNVEGMDLLFMNRNRPPVMPEQVRLAYDLFFFFFFSFYI